MPNQPGAVLIAEIGSVTTRVTLIDLVDGEFRLISQAETFSTVELPHQDAMLAVLEAAGQISEQTTRRLLKDDGTLLIPQNNERDGVDRFVAITSASNLLSLVITAIASDLSARSAIHASRSTYTSILQVITLDDAPRQQVSENERSWIERQVQTLLGLQPDAFILAGGLEGGASDVLKRLAHIVALTATRPNVDATGHQRHDIFVRPVLFAGNSAAREQVLTALTGRSKPIVVDNVRPTLTQDNLDPARRALTSLYEEQVLSKQAGFGALRRTSNVPLNTVCAAQGLMTRFLSEQYGRQLLTLDVGATNSAAYVYSAGRYSPAVLGNSGLGYGLSSIISQRGVKSIARWLPFAISEQDLTHRLLNKLLRPQVIPSSREELWIELAVAREVIANSIELLQDERPNFAYDMVLLSGSVFAHAPHPGMALLAALDGLRSAHAIRQPSETSNPENPHAGMLLDIYVDTLGLLAAAGAVAPLNGDAAVTLCELDLLRNTPLATCVVVQGEGRVGDVALEAELIPVQGKSQQLSLRHGEIGRLRLNQGQKGQLVLRPAPGVRIGSNAPGVEISTDLGAIDGSALGVVIDARGNSVLQEQDLQKRLGLIWNWMQALGAVRGPSPYTDLPLPVEAPVITEIQPQEASPANEMVEALTLETPSESGKKKGFSLFGNKKPKDQQAKAEKPQKPEKPKKEKGKKGKGASDEQPVIQEVAAPPSSEEAAMPSVIGSSEVIVDSTPQKGKRISLDELAQLERQSSRPATPSSPAAAAPQNLENDLNQLRQTFEEDTAPKKKGGGLFGRKK
jgi:hypothetical protein